MRIPIFILVLSGMLPAIAFAEDAVAPPEKTPPAPSSPTVPALDEFLIIPLRVYRLKSTDLPAANCALADKDVRRIVGKVNRVWAYGGIYFGLESIQEETAATDKLLRLPEKKAEQQAEPNKDSEKEILSHEKQKEQKENAKEKSGDNKKGQGVDALRDSQLYRALIPAKTREFAGFRVYYIHDFEVNGIYYGGRESMVKETARLRAVPGGIDEPLPRVTAHELGHGLSLPHRQEQTNLMASGTNGTTLNEAEIKQARGEAGKLKATMAYADLENTDDRASRAASQLHTAWANDLRALHKELEAASRVAPSKAADDSGGK